MIISRTPFRISFFGGGTDYPVWYRNHRGAVLATSIDKYCYLHCRYLPPFFKHKYRLVYSKLENVNTLDEIQHPSVRETLRYLRIKEGIAMQYDSDLPARAGLGTSSSFTVGLLNALYGLKGKMVSKQRLAEEAIHIEQNMIKENVGCYSEDTEILTKNGWKKHNALNIGDEILTLNINNFVPEYQSIKKIWRYQWNKLLYHFYSKTVDLLVTPNHNMLVQRSARKYKPKIYFRKSEELFHRCTGGEQLVRKSNWQGQECDIFELPAYYNKWKDGPNLNAKREYHSPSLQIRMDDWLAFLGLYLSEGSLSRGGGHHSVNIWQSKTNPIMESALKRLPFNVFRIKNCWTIHDARLYNYCQQFGKSFDKYIPREILQLSTRQLKILLDYLILGDGHIRDAGGKVYYTSSVQLADDVQEIFQKIGSEAFIRQRNRIGKPVLNGICKHLSYEVIERRKFHTETRTLKTSRYKYSGIVWCVTVPNNTVYVRRNGNAIWCGNSQDQITASFGGFNRIEFKENSFTVQPILLPHKLLQDHLLLFFTGFLRTASEVAGEQIKKTPQRKMELSRLYQMVDEARHALEYDLFEFGELLHESWMIKRKLTKKITTPEINKIYQKARKLGAIGGKICGAGAGGFMFFFVEPKYQQRMIENLGLLHVPFKFENQGSQIIYYKEE